MKTLLICLATLSGTLGTGALYMMSPNQKMLANRLSGKLVLAVAGLLLLVSLILFLQTSGPAAAFFILMTLIMAIWSLLPFPFALARRSAKRSRK